MAHGEAVGGGGEPLPDWFDNFTAQSVLAAYAEGDVAIEPPFLLLARFDDPILRQERYYDHAQAEGDDAPVTQGLVGGGDTSAESLREYLAWTAFINARSKASPQLCRGVMEDMGGDIAGLLASCMQELGFHRPLATGPCVGLYERDALCIACLVEPLVENRGLFAFRIGGPNIGSLRRLLGELSTRGVDVRVTAWEPRVPR